MCSVFTVINQKGGVAKTTSTFAISSELAKKGLRVLMIDLDPQANLTTIAGLEPKDLEKTIATVFIAFCQKKRIGIDTVILELKENLFLAPSVIDLSAVDTYLQNTMSREYVLKRILAPILPSFDAIFIDCQPSLSLLPLNALACSTDVIIPCSTEYLSYRGLELIKETVTDVQETLNENLKIDGVIATKHEASATHNKKILDLLERNYQVLGVIPKSVKVSDAIYDASSITDVNPTSKPAIAYKAVTEKIYNIILENQKGDK